MRKAICLSLVLTFLVTPLNSGSGEIRWEPPQQGTTVAEPTLQEKLAAIQPGTRIEVQLRNKEKLRGRMGRTADEGFVVQIGNGTTLQDRMVPFSEVESVKKSGSRALKILAGVGIVALAVILIGAWAYGCSTGLGKGTCS